MSAEEEAQVRSTSYGPMVHMFHRLPPTPQIVRNVRSGRKPVTSLFHLTFPFLPPATERNYCNR